MLIATHTRIAEHIVILFAFGPCDLELRTKKDLTLAHLLRCLPLIRKGDKPVCVLRHRSGYFVRHQVLHNSEADMKSYPWSKQKSDIHY